MPNVAQVLKAEIARIAKHETKVALAQPKKTGIANTKTLAAVKRRLAEIEKNLSALQKTLQTCCSGSAPVEEPAGPKAWLTGRGVKGLRRKMRLSQQAFARLVKVSTAAIIRWEKKAGKLTIRGNKMANILALRGVGVQEAKRRLADMGKKAKGSSARK